MDAASRMQRASQPSSENTAPRTAANHSTAQQAANIKAAAGLPGESAVFGAL